MEPVTHILTGACLSRSGFNRKAAYATLAMAIGAEFPDIDTVWSLHGSVASFQHHRGITHTFIGLPVEALAIVAGIYSLHTGRTAWARKRATPQPALKAPLRWGLLYGFTLLALLSHLLLDFTNNYGVRPFFPFNPRWYAGSIVFIFDPLIFGLLLCALIAPLLFGLVSSEVGARKPAFRGRGWAIAALVGILALWTLRAFEHSKAVQLASAQTLTVLPDSGSAPQVPDAANLPPPESQPVFLPAQRVLASPDPFNPFLWYAATDYGPQYQLAEIDTHHNTVEPSNERLPKPSQTSDITAAEASLLGRAYLDWSPMPMIQAGKPEDGFTAPGETIVTFRDLRFLGGPAIIRRGDNPPLTGTVELDAQGHIVAMMMDSRP